MTGLGRTGSNVKKQFSKNDITNGIGIRSSGMTEDSNVPWGLLTHYLSNESTEGEKAKVEAWVGDNPEYNALVDRFRQSWENSKNPIRPPLDVAAIKQLVVSKVAATIQPVHQANPEKGVSKPLFSGQTFQSDAKKYGLLSGLKVRQWAGYSAIAAASMVIIALAAMKYVPGGASVQKLQGYATAAGQRATVTLRDGSTVTLGPATTISVTGRHIELSGEALFTVSHKDGSPFTVKTGSVVTRVLGTTFAIRKYEDDELVRVAVAEGRVAVDDVVLSNGDLALAGSTVKVQHDSELVSNLLSFAQGHLVINGQSLSSIEHQVERWLNVEVKIDAGVTTKPFSTTITTQSSSEVLRELATLTNSSYTISGRSVAFHARP